MLNPILSWILFSRIAGSYSGFHNSTILMLGSAGLISFVLFVKQDFKRLKNMPYIPRYIELVFSFLMLVFFAISLEEIIFNPLWIIANIYFNPSTLSHFNVMIMNNALNYRNQLLLDALLCTLGIFWFRKYFKPKIYYWMPFIAITIIWLVGFDLITSLPLPDGSGYFAHDSITSNAFEVLFILTFSIAFTLSFLHGFKNATPKMVYPSIDRQFPSRDTFRHILYAIVSPYVISTLTIALTNYAA